MAMAAFIAYLERTGELRVYLAKEAGFGFFYFLFLEYLGILVAE